MTRLTNLTPAERPVTERATIGSSKTLPPPVRRGDLAFSAMFTKAESERLKRGLIPREMEDKWFICLHDGWLLFYRSWTGYCIYGLRLDAKREGFAVAESWVNRDPKQYRGTDIDYDRELLRHLIDALLLHRSAS